jgi:hypothetical protein
MKSFYLLELEIDPGGARKWAQFAYPTLAQVQRALDVDFWEDLTLLDGSFLLFYDERVRLRTFIGGEKVGETDLRPFIMLRRPNGAVFPLSRCTYQARSPGGKEVWALPGGKARSSTFFNSATAYVDWGAVPVAPLPPPLLAEGELVPHPEGDLTNEDDAGDEWTGFRHGCYDLGAGLNDADYRASVAEYLTVDPDWLRVNAGAVRALAASMSATGDYSGMPVLADALTEAGCANGLFLWHCRAPACAHARGSWLVELLLERSVG